MRSVGFVFEVDECINDGNEPVKQQKRQFIFAARKIIYGIDQCQKTKNNSYGTVVFDIFWFDVWLKTKNNKK